MNNAPLKPAPDAPLNRPISDVFLFNTNAPCWNNQKTLRTAVNGLFERGKNGLKPMFSFCTPTNLKKNTRCHGVSRRFTSHFDGEATLRKAGPPDYHTGWLGARLFRFHWPRRSSSESRFQAECWGLSMENSSFFGHFWTLSTIVENDWRVNNAVEKLNIEKCH